MKNTMGVMGVRVIVENVFLLGARMESRARIMLAASGGWHLLCVIVLYFVKAVELLEEAQRLLYAAEVMSM